MALLRALTEAVGVSGDEGEVRRLVREQIESLADEVRVDALGNLLALRRGSARRRVRVMLSAHMDEVGLMVSGVEPDGVLHVARVGGVTPNQLAGKAFWVGKGRVPGVIGLTPPQDAKLLWISDTLHLTELECSAVYLDAARSRSNLEILTDLRELPFDAAGNLPGVAGDREQGEEAGERGTAVEVKQWQETVS